MKRKKTIKFISYFEVKRKKDITGGFDVYKRYRISNIKTKKSLYIGKWKKIFSV